MGKEAEFEAFALAVTPRLLRTARLLCGDHHHAEDLVQEALAKVYVRWMRPWAVPIDHPTAYALTALTRTFVSSRRKASNTERSTEPEALATVRDGADEIAATDLRITLDRALATLSDTDRAVLVLRYLEQLDVAETAAVLGIRPGAVRSRTHRALPRLAEALGVDPAQLAHPRNDTPLEGERR